MKIESLHQRQEELQRKEFWLKESLLKFDKFLKVSTTYKSENSYFERLLDDNDSYMCSLMWLLGENRSMMCICHAGISSCVGIVNGCF